MDQAPTVRDARPDERLAWIALALAPLESGRREAMTERFVRLPAESPPDQAGLAVLGALRGSRLVGATLVHLIPGSAAETWPPGLVDPDDGPAALALLQATIASARRHGRRFLQTFLDRDDARTAARLASAGFAPLADVVYLWKELRPDDTSPPAGAWRPYASADRAAWESLVAATFQGSLDTPRLNDLRSPGEFLDGCLAATDDPSTSWFRLVEHEQDLGCLLLSTRPDQTAELVYLGLIPAARGRGFGAILLGEAERWCRSRRLHRIVTAVDRANVPALKRYREFGYAAWNLRSVWAWLAP
jgi:GNAT superfamily N-acetyltransferase